MKNVSYLIYILASADSSRYALKSYHKLLKSFLQLQSSVFFSQGHHFGDLPHGWSHGPHQTQVANMFTTSWKYAAYDSLSKTQKGNKAYILMNHHGNWNWNYCSFSISSKPCPFSTSYFMRTYRPWPKQSRLFCTARKKKEKENSKASQKMCPDIRDCPNSGKKYKKYPRCFPSPQKLR